MSLSQMHDCTARFWVVICMAEVVCKAGRSLRPCACSVTNMNTLRGLRACSTLFPQWSFLRRCPEWRVSPMQRRAQTHGGQRRALRKKRCRPGLGADGLQALEAGVAKLICEGMSEVLRPLARTQVSGRLPRQCGFHYAKPCPKQWVPFPALKKGGKKMEPTMGSIFLPPFFRAGK